MSKEKRIEELKESFEGGILSKKEYEEQKEKISEEPEAKMEEADTEEPMEEKGIKKSDKILIASVLALILLFAVFFSYRAVTKPQPQTLDELHLFNLKGKLKAEQGYIYKDAYSFVNFDNLWYMQLKSPQGTRLYNMALRYGPKDLENIKIKGRLNSELLDNATDYYVTFNPTGTNFSHVALAAGDFNQHMVNVFFKMPIAACDKNETLACRNRPIATCENKEKIVLYIKEANETNVYYDDNCIVVEGSGFELVKGVDRVLLNLYGIMEQ